MSTIFIILFLFFSFVFCCCCCFRYLLNTSNNIRFFFLLFNQAIIGITGFSAFRRIKLFQFLLASFHLCSLVNSFSSRARNIHYFIAAQMLFPLLALLVVYCSRKIKEHKESTQS